MLFMFLKKKSPNPNSANTHERLARADSLARLQIWGTEVYNTKVAFIFRRGLHAPFRIGFREW